MHAWMPQLFLKFCFFTPQLSNIFPKHDSKFTFLLVMKAVSEGFVGSKRVCRKEYPKLHPLACQSQIMRTCHASVSTGWKTNINTKNSNHMPFLHPLFISYSKMMFHQKKCISLLLVSFIDWKCFSDLPLQFLVLLCAYESIHACARK